MEKKSEVIVWYHSIIATDKNKVISVMTRNFDEMDIMHKFLDIPLNEEKIRNVKYVKVINLKELEQVLYMFKDYQEYKEIEFLKACIYYLRKAETTELEFTFHNN